MIICRVSLYFVTDIRAVGRKGGGEAVLWVNTGLEIINISNQNKQINIISVSLPRATAVTNSAFFSAPPHIVMISEERKSFLRYLPAVLQLSVSLRCNNCSQQQQDLEAGVGLAQERQTNKGDHSADKINCISVPEEEAVIPQESKVALVDHIPLLSGCQTGH